MAPLSALRARLYQALAEGLAEPPRWLAWPGCDWPLFEAARRLAPASAAARRALRPLAAIPAEPAAIRRKRYAALFAGPGRPALWLNESAALTGRLLGPATLAVERFYREAGVEAVGAEVPDHASLELAFLALAAERGAEKMERDFLRRHARRWLPGLGRALMRSGDPVYAPIGQLLADWLGEEEAGRARPGSPDVKAAPIPASLPVLRQAEACTLCGFCVQVCPARALAVREDALETRLQLSPAACVACRKCERVCEPQTLRLAPPTGAESVRPDETVVLRRSPRVRCLACDRPIVSQAEIHYVMARIGHPAWLDYCSRCRPGPEAQP